jgi:hypothetical protein
MVRGKSRSAWVCGGVGGLTVLAEAEGCLVCCAAGSAVCDVRCTIWEELERGKEE